MSDARGKRKYAGPPVAELRKTEARDKRHLSPHHKPKEWGLTIEWTEVRTLRRERKFTSRAARDEARTRIARHFVEQAKKPPRPKYRWWRPEGSPFAEFYDTDVCTLKEGPKFIETYGDATDGSNAAQSAP